MRSVSAWGGWTTRAAGALLRHRVAMLAGLAALASGPARGGPGLGGGNPQSVVVTGLAKNYLFLAPRPATVKLSPAADVFEFAGAGYALSVRRVPYDPAVCAAGGGKKAVCVEAHAGRVAAMVVFPGAADTLALELTGRGAGAEGLRAAMDDLIFGLTTAIDTEGAR